MSLIGQIGGVPLFTTVQEALAWGAANGMSGYHPHNLNGQQGFMGGANHQTATGMPMNSNAPQQQPQNFRRSDGIRPNRPTTTVRSRNSNISSSSSSSSGGGGGY